MRVGQNYIQNGDSIQIAIPAGGCSRNTPIKIGNGMLGVPANSFSAGVEGNVEVFLEGVFANLPLHNGDVPSQGDLLYWDNGAGELTTTVGSNLWAGWCWETVTSGTVVTLKLRIS